MIKIEPDLGRSKTIYRSIIVKQNGTSIQTDDLSLKGGISSILAGYIAGSCGLVVGHPLDSIKVLMQTSSGANGNSGSTSPLTASANFRASSLVPLVSASKLDIQKRGKASSVLVNQLVTDGPTRAMQSGSSEIIKSRSIISLYAGIGVPLLTIGMVQSLTFGMYDSFRRILYAKDMEREHNVNLDNVDMYLYNDSLLNTAFASFAAGGIISIITSPLQVIKTKQQVMQWSMKKTAVDTFRQAGGIRNFYAGFGAHFFCDAPGRVIYFTAYEFLKRYALTRKSNTIDENSLYNNAKLTIHERMLCAGIAGQLCWSLIFPLDVIRCKIYANAAQCQSGQAPSRSSLHVAKEMWKMGGFRPFFRGYGITIIRAGPVAAAVLPVYDISLEWLKQKL